MIPPEQCKPNWTAIGVIGGFIINIASWFFIHFLTKRREIRRDHEAREQQISTAKESRKRDFLAFMAGWKAEIERNYAHNTFRIVFSDFLPEFQRQVSLISGDITDKSNVRFAVAVDSMTNYEKDRKEHGIVATKEQIFNIFDIIVECIHDA